MKNNIIINIGRQFGSGGKDIARELGLLMGFPVYDNELIIKAAQDSGISAELFKCMDEKKNFFSFFNYGAENYLNDNGLFQIQSETIRNIAENGSAIIIGRCADYILRELPNTINIYVTAPMEYRIQRTIEIEKINPEEAESYIIKKDKQRESYYNYYTFGDWGMASNYDFCIDSSILGIKGSAEMIKMYVDKVMENK